MRVETIIKLYDDTNEELMVGDYVKVTTKSGLYEGSIKKILPKSFSIILEKGDCIQILYNDIVYLDYLV